MSILIGLIPALGWGLMPVAATKIGGKPYNQIIGTTAGTLLVAIIAYCYFQPSLDLKSGLLSALSGACWVIGQIGQFNGFAKLGVSRTMPISTGLQLVGTSLIGVFVFGEWDSTLARVVGFGALALVVVGVALTALSDKKQKGGADTKALLVLFFTTFGFLAYNSIPVAAGAEGPAIFPPQAVGMVCAALLYVLFSKHGKALREPVSWKNIISGLLFAAAALAYIFSAQQNGIATGFVLAQLSVVISTLCGILLLKEEKTAFELKATIAGLILVVIGSVTTAFL